VSIYILGASDPEMEEVESVLRQHGQGVLYATVGLYRVHSGVAYASEGVADAERTVTLATWISTVPAGASVYLVECGFNPVYRDEADDVSSCRGISIRMVDHHHPGDPGYGRPPVEYLARSDAYLAREGANSGAALDRCC